MLLQQYARANPGKLGVTRPGFGRLSIAACSFVVSVCTTILIARLLTPGAFGIYIFVLWLATAAVPAIGVGMLTVTSRHIAEEPAGAASGCWRLPFCLAATVPQYPALLFDL